MAQENKSYRIRTKIGSEQEPVVHIDMTQSFDKFEILSLTLDQTNNYAKLTSDYGIIVGRVLANGGFGIPNAKISVFVKYEDTDDMYKKILYNYSSTKSKNDDGVRYNLLPKELNDECHQNIGTFPTKRMVLDDNTWIEIFDKYYKYTTKTNNAGDYMIYGVPVGNQTLHVDIDMSDIGVLSQRPRDMIYKGANVNQFDSPNKFRTDTNLDYLAQVFTQDKVLYVYPFWGDTTDNELGAAITRCDIDIDYRFEPTCIFMGSVMTDTGENALSKKCVGQKNQGKMSDMITGQGTIEMIRKTPDGFVEQYSVMGNQVIDTDGVWCYQIPMNLDYVITDEYGNTVLSDDPNKGIATRTRVRFRIGMSDTGTKSTARKRAKYLVPNNPKFNEEEYPKFCETNGLIDYEFGTKTREEDFRDLFWNKVYSVKSYIPRLQKSRLPNNKKRTGIKMVNHSGGNNPMPFNALGIKFNFTYMFLCALLKVLVWVVLGINKVLTSIAYLLNEIGGFFLDIYDWFYGIYEDLDDEWWCPGWFARVFKSIASPFKSIGCWFRNIAYNSIGNGITLSGLCIDDDGNEKSYNPGVISGWKGAKDESTCGYHKDAANTNVSELFNCVENQLAQENEVTSFNFENDWINGVLYLPLWYRKIKPKKKYFFGLITISAKDQWCNSDTRITTSKKMRKHLKLYRTCAIKTKVNGKTNSTPMGTLDPLPDNDNVFSAYTDPDSGIEYILFNNKNEDNCYGYDCHKSSRTYIPIDKGIIVKKETMLGDEVYYYKPVDINTYTESGEFTTLFATDLILLGSLNDCDLNGIPQFFKALESTTYNMPPDLLLEDYEYNSTVTDDSEDSANIPVSMRSTENTGADWGNLGVDQSKGSDTANTTVYDNGGLFYGLTCFNSYTKPKSCINLSRICEFGVGVDESQSILKTELATSPSTMENEDVFEDMHDTLIPDGYISYDEVYDMDYRSMFATLNNNSLRTKLNFETGLYEYDFDHLYIDNFDGVLSNLMNGNNVNKDTEQSNYTTKANYRNNYKLEKSSNDYLTFRFGDYKKKNNKKIYYYDYTDAVAKRSGKIIYADKRFPRYENSFYFYFGLNEGKTAIDKFRTNYFASCTNDGELGGQFEIKFVPNEWCGEQTGYIMFDTMLEIPINLKIINNNAISQQNSTYLVKNITKQNFYIGYRHNSIEDKYKYCELVCNGNAQTYLPNGNYTIQITDSEDNVFEENLLFQGPLLDYKIDVHSFTLKNSDLEYIPELQSLQGEEKIHDGNGNLMWKKLFDAVGNYGRKDTDHEYYVYSERTIRGDIDVDITSLDEGGYYKIVLSPLNRKVFWYDFYKWYNGVDTYLFVPENKSYVCVENNNITETMFNNHLYTFYEYNDTDKVYEETTTWNSTVDHYLYGYFLYYTEHHISEDDSDNVEMIAFALFTGSDNEYDDLDKKINAGNWKLLSDFSGIQNGILRIINNYRGCDFIFRKIDNGDIKIFDTTISVDVPMTSDDEVLSYDSSTDVGYLGYNKNLQTIYFGVPYGNEKYSIEIVQLCNPRDNYDDNYGNDPITEAFIETENSVKNAVIVPEYNFKLFINEIDYDLIKNFRTGFTDENILNCVERFNSNINATENPTFSEYRMYGWNNLDHIGTEVIEVLSFHLTNIIKPINYIKEKPTNENYNTLNGKIKRYLDVLNDNYEWNGTPHYVGINMSNAGIWSLFNKKDEISSPYTWTTEYCISQENVDLYKDTVNTADNTAVRVISITTNEYNEKLPEDIFLDDVAYYLKNNGIYEGPYYKGNPELDNTLTYYYVVNTSTVNYEEEFITQNTSADNIKTDINFKNCFYIDEEHYTDNGYEISSGSHDRMIIFSDLNINDKTINLKIDNNDISPVIVPVNKIVDDNITKYYYNNILAATVSNEIEYMIYNTSHGYIVNVTYNNYISHYDKILPIIYTINDVIVKRQNVANQMKATFRMKQSGTNLYITYKSNEPPIEYTCIGSTESDTALDKKPIRIKQ